MRPARPTLRAFRVAYLAILVTFDLASFNFVSFNFVSVNFVSFKGASSGRARADDPAPIGAPASTEAAKESERLFDELKSESFRAREVARARLAALAPRIRPQLEARRDDADPEVRRVVLGLLAGLGISTEATTVAAALSSADLVTLEADGTLLQVLGRLERLVEGRVRVPASSADAAVKVSADARPYFEVLDGLLASARLEISEGFDVAGQGIASARDPKSSCPVGYAGPFRLEVESVSTTKLLRGGARSRITLLLRLVWAPSIQVVTYTAPTVASTKDSSGADLVATDVGNLVRVPDSTRSTASFALSLEPSGDTLSERIDRLELGVRIRRRRAKATVVFEKPLSTAFPVHRTFALTLPEDDRATPAAVSLDQFGPDPERPGWWIGAVSARLPVGVASEGVMAALESSDGLLRPMSERSSRISGSDGSVRLTLRAVPLAAGAEPIAIRASCYWQEEEVPVKFVLTAVPLR